MCVYIYTYMHANRGDAGATCPPSVKAFTAGKDSSSSKDSINSNDSSCGSKDSSSKDSISGCAPSIKAFTAGTDSQKCSLHSLYIMNALGH